MASKFIALFALVAVASAQHYQNDYYQQQYQPQYQQQQYHAAPAVIKQVQPAILKTVQPAYVKKVEYAEEPANYEFNYDVHDEHTGDIKQQHEKASNGAITGQYSLIDADGYRRIVDYTADDHHGFQATVRREPVEGHKIVKTIQPVTKIIAQPAIAVQKYVAPAPQYYQPAPVVQKYVAPAQQYYQSAPVVQKYVAPAQQYYQPAPVVQKYVAPAQQYYQAPVQKYVAPAQQYYQPAPVVEKYVAPAQQYYQAPVQKYVAPVVQKVAVAAPVKYTSAENSAHVSFNAPAINYHY